LPSGKKEGPKKKGPDNRFSQTKDQGVESTILSLKHSSGRVLGEKVGQVRIIRESLKQPLPENREIAATSSWRKYSKEKRKMKDV